MERLKDLDLAKMVTTKKNYFGKIIKHGKRKQDI